MRLIRVIVLIAIALLAPAAVLADSTGSVRGYVVAGYYHREYVKDLIPEVIVTYSSPAGVFSAHTNANGFYTIFGMPPGKYRIVATTPEFGYDLLLSSYHACIHAGENSYRNLVIGFRDLPNRAAIEAFDYKAQFRPDASQTADLHSIGDC